MSIATMLQSYLGASVSVGMFYPVARIYWDEDAKMFVVQGQARYKGRWTTIFSGYNMDVAIRQATDYASQNERNIRAVQQL